jgi:hypothetical protein
VQLLKYARTESIQGDKLLVRLQASQPSLAGLAIYSCFPGTCFAACRATFSRACGALMGIKGWIFDCRAYFQFCKLSLYWELRSSEAPAHSFTSEIDGREAEGSMHSSALFVSFSPAYYE